MFLGGRLDDGEIVYEVVVRECEEEFGFVLNVDLYLGLFDEYVI